MPDDRKDPASPTSVRFSRPRAAVERREPRVTCQTSEPDRSLLSSVFRRPLSVLGRPGSDRLSQALRLSTIGAEGFNGRVRNGIGFRPLAIATKSAKRRQKKPRSLKPSDDGH